MITVKPLTKLNFDASDELELNAFMLDKKSQFPDYWNCCKNKRASYEFWRKLIGEEARERIKCFYLDIHNFRIDVTKKNCDVNIVPFKRKDTNRSLDVTKASEGAVIGPVDDSTSDPVDNEMASKKAKHNDEETTAAEVSDGDVIGTEERKVVVEAEVSDGVIVGSDAETNFYADAMDDVLSYDSSFVSNEHTDQDNVSGSVNNIDKSADDAVRHFSLNRLNVDRNDPCDKVELDENIFLPHQQVVRHFNFNGLNAEQDALSFQFEMTKVILMVREGTVLKDYYVYLIFLRCIEREKDDINVHGWNYFFGRFNKFVRTKVLSFLKAAMVVWVLNGNDKDNLQSLQQIIDNRQAHRIDFETFYRDTAANRVYAKALLNRVSEQVYFINLLVIDSPLVHSLG